MIVQMCIGSSCHIKGSQEIVEMMKKSIEENRLESDVILAGSFCTGKCTRTGVTITVDDKAYTGITKDTFAEFFKSEILSKI